jgi:hypothetical protein
LFPYSSFVIARFMRAIQFAFKGKAKWMARTSRAMTNVGIWRKLPEHHRMHDAAGQEGEAARDQQSANIDAEHRALVHRDVVRPGAAQRADHAEQDQAEFGISAWMNKVVIAVTIISAR